MLAELFSYLQRVFHFEITLQIFSGVLNNFFCQLSLIKTFSSLEVTTFDASVETTIIYLCTWFIKIKSH